MGGMNLRMRRRGLITVIVACLALPAATRAQPRDLGDYVIFGIDAVDLGGRTSVETGAIGVAAGTARLGGSVRVDDVVAPTLIAGRRTILRNPFCRTLRWRGHADRVCAPLTVPIVSTLPSINPVAIDTQADSVKVPRDSTREVSAGTYRTLMAGPRSTVRLLGGVYDLAEVKIKRDGRVQCLAPCVLNVRGNVTIKSRGRLEPAAKLSPSKVSLVIFGSRRPTALRTRNRSVVGATVYAPLGVLRLGGGTYNGAFVGARVRTRGVASFSVESGF